MTTDHTRSSLGTTADTLHGAARLIRSDWGDPRPKGTAWHQARDFHLAVATWLDACALVLGVSPDATKAHALAVAKAYLGQTAASAGRSR